MSDGAVEVVEPEQVAARMEARLTENIARSPFAELEHVPPQVRAMLVAALDRMAAHPQIQRVRRVAREALAPAPGQRLLDVGCGAGEVARELATLVAPDGEVLAVDLSGAIVAIAAERHDASNVRYAVGDIAALAFPDADFDGVRAERVLQHVSDPDAAVAELTRVVRPGGRVCLVDTDWESLAVDGLPESMVAAVRAHVMAGRTPHHPSMGRTLRRRLVHAGLVGVTCEPVPLWFTDPTEAAIVTPIFNPQIPREAGLIPDDLRAAWFAAMGAAAACRDFLAVSTIWVAAGVKPA